MPVRAPPSVQGEETLDFLEFAFDGLFALGIGGVGAVGGTAIGRAFASAIAIA